MRILATLLISIVTLAPAAEAYISPTQYYDPARRLILNVGETKWDFFSGDDLTSRTTTQDSELQFVARAPSVTKHNTQATLTLRVDRGDWKSARAYAEKWLKDFPKFGYELQMSRDTRYGNLDGYDIELSSSASHRRARQFIVKQAHEIWVFTCSSEYQNFQTAWSACEKILKTASAR